MGSDYDPEDIPIPPMPHRMRSNLTFQPAVKTGIKLDIKQDKISQMEKDRQ